MAFLLIYYFELVGVMKVWLVSFVLLFCLAQFVLWVKDFFSPLPVYILGGAVLAIASNYHKGFASFLGDFGDYLPQTAILLNNLQQNYKAVLPPSLPSPSLLPEKTDSKQD